MSDAVTEFRPGEMDIRNQISTYRLFGSMMKWGSLAVAALVVMLVLWFCVGAGFWAGFLAAIVLVAVGVFFLRSKPRHAQARA